jgi:hypothetical protein
MYFLVHMYFAAETPPMSLNTQDNFKDTDKENVSDDSGTEFGKDHPFLCCIVVFALKLCYYYFFLKFIFGMNNQTCSNEKQFYASLIVP